MYRRLHSLNALRAFEAAGRLGLMKLAAEELHVTHSAISRHIQHLESVLGVRLFEGSKNAPKLTESGRRLLPELTTAFDQMDRAVRSVAKNADNAEGALDISCLGTLTMRWLIPRLHRFRTDHPTVDVRLSTSDSPVDFLRDNFDVAIRVGKEPWPEDAVVIPLFPEKFGPVHAPSINLGIGETPNPVLLHTFTRLSAWADWSERSGVSLDAQGTMEYEHFYFMLEAAVAGLGVCIAPWPLVSDDIAMGRLVAPFGFIESDQTYVALRRQRKNRNASLFCNWLQQAAGEFVS
ncbi:LysR family transcriptional regulator [Brenneria goodwinii]|uniref:Transcriptional regulator, LysR family n=1 Tax=Brenneria goodwinii TaxID=1109412 RepID=A0A0G4JUW6_9GAMM|nr:LysR family transcriptional regulator [Brenneria goodwinii]CPR16637.1 Transcriptional regulator, LysR family [Brenneria goodwinii]